MLTWLPVLTDCNGGQEAVAGYAIMVMAIWVAEWVDCGGASFCPVYARTDWTEVGFTEGTEWVMEPVPLVGGVDIYRIVAVDLAGNRSGEVCQ